MTRSDIWRLDASLYVAARRRWIDRDGPSPSQIEAVDDWVLDCMLDPSAAGRPDVEVDGVWIGRPGLSTIVLYGLNLDERLIAVFEIGSN